MFTICDRVSAEKQEAKKDEQSHREAKRNNGCGCHNGHSFTHGPYIFIISRGANIQIRPEDRRGLEHEV